MFDVVTVSLLVVTFLIMGLLAGEAGTAFIITLVVLPCESLKSALRLYSSINLTDNSFYS